MTTATNNNLNNSEKGRPLPIILKSLVLTIIIMYCINLIIPYDTSSTTYENICTNADGDGLNLSEKELQDCIKETINIAKPLNTIWGSIVTDINNTFESIINIFKNRFN